MILDMMSSWRHENLKSKYTVAIEIVCRERDVLWNNADHSFARSQRVNNREIWLLVFVPSIITKNNDFEYDQIMKIISVEPKLLNLLRKTVNTCC